MPTNDSAVVDGKLVAQVREVLHFFAGRVPSRAEIETLARERGVSFANKVLHAALLESSLHGPFIRHIQALQPQPIERPLARKPTEVVFVPSVLWGARQDWGGHAEWMRRTARELGFMTDVVETDHRESISGNARRLGDYLTESASERIIFVTHGRGAAEFRMLLQRRGPQASELRKVRGWLNIAGASAGSRLIDLLLARRLNQLEARFDFWLHGRKPSALQELSARFPFWKERLAIHEKMLVVNVVGLPSQRHIPPHLERNFDLLSPFGPNDGGVLVADAMIRPGLIFPVLGMSHQASPVVLKPVLQRLLICTEQQICRTDALHTKKVGEYQWSDNGGVGLNHELGSVGGELAPGNLLVRDGA